MEAFLSKIVYTFAQEGNTDGTTSETEELIVTVDSGHGGIEKEGGYLVLRTDTGWSINDAKEMAELLSYIENGVSSLSEKERNEEKN